MHDTKKQNISRRKKIIRFPGICRHAEELGVTRIHLYLVLSGQRPSRRLMSRYQTLTQKGAAA